MIQAIIELAEHAAKDPWDVPEAGPRNGRLCPPAWVRSPGRAAELRPISEQHKAGPPGEGGRRQEGSAGARSQKKGLDADKAKGLMKELEADIVRNAILDTGMRIDGRDTKTVRPIIAEVGILPRAHGSALFTRGETQALCVATLGTGQDEQIIDQLEGESRAHFMLHYNFPPYSCW